MFSCYFRFLEPCFLLNAGKSTNRTSLILRLSINGSHSSIHNSQPITFIQRCCMLHAYSMSLSVTIIMARSSHLYLIIWMSPIIYIKSCDSFQIRYLLKIEFSNLKMFDQYFRSKPSTHFYRFISKFTQMLH